MREKIEGREKRGERTFDVSNNIWQALPRELGESDLRLLVWKLVSKFEEICVGASFFTRK